MITYLLELLVLAGRGLAGILRVRRKAKAADLETAAHTGDKDAVNAALAKARRESKLLPLALLGALAFGGGLFGGCAARVEYVPSTLTAEPIEWQGTKGWFVPSALMADLLTTLDAHTRCKQ